MVIESANITLAAGPDGKLEISIEDVNDESQASILLSPAGVRALYEALEIYILTGQVGYSGTLVGN